MNFRLTNHNSLYWIVILSCTFVSSLFLFLWTARSLWKQYDLFSAFAEYYYFQPVSLQLKKTLEIIAQWTSELKGGEYSGVCCILVNGVFCIQVIEDSCSCEGSFSKMEDAQCIIREYSLCRVGTCRITH